MDQDQYREQRQSGALVADAELQSEQAYENTSVIEEEEVNEQPEHEQPEDHQEQEEQEELSEQDDLPPLSEKEKTAFEKRMEREERKIREKLEAELKERYEQQYGKHKAIIDLLGGDPDAVEKRIKEQKIIQDAQFIAEQQGWDEEQTQWYIQQQKTQNELKELRVQSQINRLRDNPDYIGISSMEREIINKIDQTNGALTVEEAYWALGGKSRAEQIRLEAKVRESVKRQQQPRTVLTDSQASSATEKPLPPEVLKDAERMGISAAEARKLMSKEPAKNLAEWRKQRKK